MVDRDKANRDALTACAVLGAFFVALALGVYLWRLDWSHAIPRDGSSLVVGRDSVPDCLEVTAHTSDGTVMGLRHREHPVEGVQFHPESILTASGHDLLRNFLARAA